MTGPTADRIAELEGERLRLDTTWAVGVAYCNQRDRIKQIDAELSRLRDEQPRDKTDEWDGEHAKSRVIVQDENGRFKAIDKHAPSPTTSPEPQDVREKIARALYEQERKRGEHCNDILTGMMRKPIGGCSIEPWEECSETFLADADAVLAALAQSDARVCLGCDLSGECHAFDNPTQVCELCEHHEPLTVEAVNRAFKAYGESRKVQSDAQLVGWPTDEQVEMAARAICEDDGTPPDEIHNGKPLWRANETVARKALEAAITAPHRSDASGLIAAADGFAELRQANVARNVEWTKGNTVALSPSFRGNELAGEVGEACNVLKKIERERLGLVGSRATVEQLAEELADVIISADLTAMDFGIDLFPAVRDKFNATSNARGLQTKLRARDADRSAPRSGKGGA